MQGKKPIHAAVRTGLSSLALAGAFSASMGAAQASTFPALLQPAMTTTSLQSACASTERPALPFTAAPTGSRSTASGEMSALERMRSQQSAVGTELADAALSDVPEPAAGGARPAVNLCALVVGKLNEGTLAGLSPQSLRPTPAADFLASRRVSISKTPFDAQWARVYGEPVNYTIAGPTGGASADPMGTLQAVNAWVNNRITYVEDRVLFNRADHWAGAQQTLALGMGDCEDIAITKMQMLASAGFRREDMFLTIAKDAVRRMDHALLVVKIGKGFVVLDNTTDQLLDGAMAHDYSPVITLSAGRAWVHGY